MARASQDRPTGIQNTSTQCAWGGHIHIMHFGPLTDLYGTPGAPKRARFGPKRPFLGPLRSSKDLGVQIWCQLPPIGPTGLVTWLPHTLAFYRPSPGPPGATKGPVLAQNDPFRAPGGPEEGRYQAKVCGCHVTNCVGPISGSWDQIWPPRLSEDLRGPKKGLLGPK